MTGDPPLREGLASADPEARRRAVARLAEDVNESEAAEYLVQALGDDDWRVRKEATGVAVALAPSRIVLDRLVAALGPGDNVGLRNAAVEAIAGYGAAAVEALDTVLPSLDSDGRKLAAEALALSGQASALRSLAKMRRDADENVRIAAMDAIAIVGTTAAEEAAALLEGGLAAPGSVERFSALDALNRLGAIVAWERIQPLLADPVLGLPALGAAGRAGDPRAVGALIAAMVNGRIVARRAAVAALGDLLTSGDDCLEAVRKGLAPIDDSVVSWMLDLTRDHDLPNDVRGHALRLAAVTMRPAAIEAVLDAVRDDRLAGAAEDALATLRAAAVGPLVSRVRGTRGENRAPYLDLLGMLADDSSRGEALTAVHEALEDPSPDVVRASLLALARLGDATSLERAARWLGPSAPPAVRQSAATALAACVARHPAHARELAAAMKNDPDRASAAPLVLSALPLDLLSDADVRFLAVAVSNLDPFVRRTALDALSRFATEEAVEAVALALSDAAREVQLAAVRALGWMRSRDGVAMGVERLLALVRSSEDDSLVVAAIEALGDAKDIRALGVLREIVERGGPSRAVAAVEALGNLGGPERFDALLDALDHRDHEVVKSALAALARAGHPDLGRHAARCLEHEAWPVRRLAADLLAELGARAALEPLRARLPRETEPLVREAVERGLLRIESALSMRPSIRPPRSGGGRLE